jgi:hypothetical protein
MADMFFSFGKNFVCENFAFTSAKSGRKYTKSFCFAKSIYKLFRIVFTTFAANENNPLVT